MTREQRRSAAEFYYKPSGITGRVQDWIDNLDNEGEVDPDVRDLATLLAQREAAAVERERERCARVVEGSVGPLTDPDAAGALAFAAKRIRRPAPGEGKPARSSFVGTANGGGVTLSAVDCRVDGDGVWLDLPAEVKP